MKDLVPQYISKIEGHGTLRINYTSDSAAMQIHEGERLFEAMLVGRSIDDAIFIPQRICGVCPTAHCLAAIDAIEDSQGIRVSKTVSDLRKLMLAGQAIQSHALHLFFLVAPDYADVDSALEFAERSPGMFHMALRLKKAGDNIVEVIGGRPVHPITPEIGGFSKAPTILQLAGLRDELEQALSDAMECADMFTGFGYPELENPTQYLCLEGEPEYGFFGKNIVNSKDSGFPLNEYANHIKEYIKPYSTAKFANMRGRGFMVGAISRINMLSEKLKPLASKALKDSGVRIPTYNSFHNNFAQAIETLHFIEDAISRIDGLTEGDLSDTRQETKIREGLGFGAVEAPRGTLYYTYGVGADEKISQCNIITPTVQNLTNIESDAQCLLDITQGKERAERERLLEMLVRAYDPCITCSVH